MMGKVFIIVFISTLFIGAESIYQPTWESLDSRPLPSWYDEAKLGIFIHWGVFSVPSYSSEWFWWNWKGLPTPAIIEFMKENYRPDFTYADFAKEFTAEFFEPAEWADIFQSSGAKYIVFTSKHHEGFSNYNSKYSFNWNSMAVGPNRDIVDELAKAIRSNTDLKFGMYHSRFEWFNPLYLADKKSGFKTQDFVNGVMTEWLVQFTNESHSAERRGFLALHSQKFYEAKMKSLDKTLAELYELVKAYKPEIVWSDGDWEAPDTYWKSKEFLAWLYNESPVNATVVTNDRWGKGCSCKHGGFYTCSDRFNPGVLQKHKFENAMTIDRYSWGFRRNARLRDFLTMEQLLQTFVTTVSCGGNMLMNVGPPKHGHIAPIFEERLRDMGAWLKVNGEGIYSTRPWTYQNDTMTKGVWYTMKKSSTGKDVYAFVFEWPSTPILSLASPAASASTKVSLLGFARPVSFKPKGSQGIDITVPYVSPANMPCKYMWTFKITNVSN